jgi:hypothetical protein
MMRKIEQEMIEAIKARKDYSNDNTLVYSGSGSGCVHVHLHGHKIAILDTIDNTLTLSDCGYQTKTTKSRLNCLLNHFSLPTIYCKKGQWYIGEEEWRGNKILSIITEEDKLKESLKYAVVLGGQSQPRPYDAVLGGKK